MWIYNVYWYMDMPVMLSCLLCVLFPDKSDKGATIDYIATNMVYVYKLTGIFSNKIVGLHLSILKHKIILLIKTGSIFRHLTAYISTVFCLTGQ